MTTEPMKPGETHEMTIETKHVCPHCRGTGQPGGIMGGPEHGLCSWCKGTGRAASDDMLAYPPATSAPAIETKLDDKLLEAAVDAGGVAFLKAYESAPVGSGVSGSMEAGLRAALPVALAAYLNARPSPVAEPVGKYDDVLLPFVSMMEAELHANSGKGDRPGWMAMSREALLLEIYHHLAKLQKATLHDSRAGVREFSADVANMSMMLADVCGALPTGRETLKAAQ